MNDLESALVEIQSLEKQNLLEFPPESISDIAKREIELAHNSVGLKEYIKETQARVISDGYSLLFLISLAFSILPAQIFFRRS